jgi:hypothetical protein
MIEHPHCHGCGTPEGQPREAWKRRKGQDQLQRIESLPVVLQTVEFADYGARPLCQDCRRLAAKRVQRLTADHLALQLS